TLPAATDEAEGPPSYKVLRATGQPPDYRFDPIANKVAASTSVASRFPRLGGHLWPAPGCSSPEQNRSRESRRRTLRAAHERACDGRRTRPDGRRGGLVTGRLAFVVSGCGNGQQLARPDKAIRAVELGERLSNLLPGRFATCLVEACQHLVQGAVGFLLQPQA